jgi:hypothetical protein
MRILVDFDNIPQLLRHRGVAEIASRILCTLGDDTLSQESSVHMRFYGGWYRSRMLSRVAQSLSAEVQREFPQYHPVFIGGKRSRIKVSGELALSLEFESSRHLWHTYRTRDYPSDLHARHPNNFGCSDPGCPSLVVYSLLNNQKCPRDGCDKRPEDIFYRGSQKLVDTMIAMDVAYLSSKDGSNICLVSSDDDFWPAIRFAVFTGATVFHVHPRTARNQTDYDSGLGSNYVSFSMEGEF